MRIMKNIKIFGKYFYLTLIVFIMNLFYSRQKYIHYTMEIQAKETEMDVFHINNDNICRWIPSLLFPLIVIDHQKKDINATKISDHKYILKNLVLNYEEDIEAYLHYFSFLKEELNATLVKPKSSYLNDVCYFGLCSKIGLTDIPENYTLLNHLKYNGGNFENKIFSFDKWELIRDNEVIQTNFYFGGSHEHFETVDENSIIGNCTTSQDDLYWGCTFKNMSFNGNIIDLKNGDNFYKIYFSSENHKIIFPIDFEASFNNITDERCSFNRDYSEEEKRYVSCHDFFNEKRYSNITLMDDKMNITLEIDNVNRYNNLEEDKNKTRILYKDVDYFIFPLIMFKNFHVQFDAETNSINFYTTDSSILQVKEDEEEKKYDNKEESSKGLKAFIIILIIVLVLGLLFLVFWIIKKRRSSMEKNINKYTKFEEDENFKDMNEKRVF